MTSEMISVDSETGLWWLFGILFVLMSLAVWLPVEPIVWGLPLWAAATLLFMITAAFIAAIAGVRYEWPLRRPVEDEKR